MHDKKMFLGLLRKNKTKTTTLKLHADKIHSHCRLQTVKLLWPSAMILKLSHYSSFMCDEHNALAFIISLQW